MWKFLFLDINALRNSSQVLIFHTVLYHVNNTHCDIFHFRISISSVTEPPSSTWAPSITMRTDASARPTPAHCPPTAWRSVINSRVCMRVCCREVIVCVVVLYQKM